MQATTSPEKRQANRRNALKSTGSRTGAGKKVASLNAMRHGLSVAVGVGQDLQLQKLTELLKQEGIDHAQARDLAIKIAEYERNVAHEFDRLLPNSDVTKCKQRTTISQATAESVVEEGLSLLEPVARKQFPDFEPMVEDVYLHRDLMGEPLSKKELREIEKLAVQTMRFAWRLEQRVQKQRILGTERYMRRATNQLIKALRAL